MSEVKDELIGTGDQEADNIQSNTMPQDATFRPHPDVVAQRLGQEVILVNLQTNRIFELNRTGARLWDLLCDGCDRTEIKQRLLQEFEVTEVQLEREIEDLLASLTKEQLITDRLPHEQG